MRRVNRDKESARGTGGKSVEDRSRSNTSWRGAGARRTEKESDEEEPTPASNDEYELDRCVIRICVSVSNHLSQVQSR